MSEYRLKNFMEEVVRQKLTELLEEEKVCKCEHCKLDIMAIALNDLPTHYIVTEKGEVYSKVNSLMVQFSADVTTSIIKAIKIVKNNPRH